MQPLYFKLSSLAFIFIFSLFSQPSYAKSCVAVLADEVIRSRYPLALGPAFNDAYRSHYGNGSKLLKKVFEFLEIGDARTQDPALVLQSVLVHLTQETSFVDRFYNLNMKPEKKQLLVDTLHTLDGRLEILNNYLRNNPIKGSDGSKLLAALNYALLKDFTTEAGFLEKTDAEVFNALGAARKQYAIDLEKRENSRAEEEAQLAQWSPESESDSYKDNDSEGEEWKRVPIEDNSASQKDSASTGNKSKPDYSLLNNKKHFESFEDLKLLSELHFNTKDTALMYAGYSKAFNFILPVIIDPIYKYTSSDINAEDLRKVFVNLEFFLSGSFDARFGAKFSSQMKEMSKTYMLELHDELVNRDLPDAFFPSEYYLEPLNRCFAIFDLLPITLD